MSGIAACNYPHACECMKQSFREMKREIEILRESAVCLSKFAMDIPLLLVEVDYIPVEQKNRLWDEIVSKMAPKAQREYRERLEQILHEKDQENVFR